MGRPKGYKNLNQDNGLGQGYFYSPKELRELNSFRAEHGLRPLKQDFCTCLFCGRVFKSPDVTNRRVCAECHSDENYCSEGSGIATVDATEMFADIDGGQMQGFPTRDNDFSPGEFGLRFSGKHRE